MTEPKWLAKAREYIGITEIKGAENNPAILALWKAAKLGGIRNDEIPWCAGFVAGVLEICHIRSPRSDSARSFLSWGLVLNGPLLGAIVIFERSGGGHVGFIVGRDADDNLMVLGGNQGDSVGIAPFAQSRVLGYRWPCGEAFTISVLPLLDSDGELSTDEV